MYFTLAKELPSAQYKHTPTEKEVISSTRVYIPVLISTHKILPKIKNNVVDLCWG